MSGASLLTSQLGGALISTTNHDQQTYDIQDLESSRSFSGADGTSRNTLVLTTGGLNTLLTDQSGLNIVLNSSLAIDLDLPAVPSTGNNYTLYTNSVSNTLSPQSIPMFLNGVSVSSITLFPYYTYFVFYTGSQWIVTFAIPLVLHGPTSNRPTNPWIGLFYLDQTLGWPVWCLEISPSVVWISAGGVPS